MAPTRKCYDDGKCYYEYTDAWHVWGRWLFLGLLIAFLLFMIPFSGYLMSLKRIQKGMQPIPGCGWMFRNPYKNAHNQPMEEQVVSQRPPRYKPYDPYIQHQKGLMLENERMRMEQLRLNNNGYSSTDLETGETEASYDEKPRR